MPTSASVQSFPSAAHCRSLGTFARRSKRPTPNGGKREVIIRFACRNLKTFH